MAEIYNIRTSSSITNIVESFEQKAEMRQIVNYSRSGMVYIQTTGERKTTYEIVCYGTTQQEGSLENAWYNGDTLRVTFNGSNYNGKIISYEKEQIPNVFDGTARQDYYKIKLTLAKVIVGNS